MDFDTLDKLLTQWHEAVQQADHWKIKEMALRKQIFDGMFIDPKVGTNKIKIAHGMALIGDYRINYKIDKPALEASRGFIPANILDDIISYRPEVRDGAWRKLDDEGKKLFGGVITETPGSPGLELKPQNKVRW